MSTRSALHPWLRSICCGTAVTLALVVPSLALAAPKKNKKSGKQKAEAAEQSSDAEAAAEAEPEPKPKKKKAKKKKKSADADVSTDAGATSDGKKGEPMKGRVGFGAMRTLSGLNGMYGRYYVANRVTVGLTAGVATFSHRDTSDTGEFDRTRTVGAIAVGPELFFWPVQGSRKNQIHADFGVGARVLTYFGFLGLTEEEQSNTLDTPVEIDIEIPAKIQLFIGPRVSINPEFGVAFRIIPGDREPDGNGDFDSNPGTGIGGRLGTENGPGFGFEVGNHAGFFMGIGVGYYFGKLRQ